MPNEIYLRTHDSLTNMVSARAATRVLQDALRASGHSAETITAAQMSDLLLGPILRDLEGILPRDGLKRNLRELVAELRAQPAPRSTQPQRSTRRAPFELEDDDGIPGDLTRPDPTSTAERTSAFPIATDATHSDTLTPAEAVTPVAGAPADANLPATSPSTSPPGPPRSASTADSRSAIATQPRPQATPPAPREYPLEKLEEAVLRFAQLENVTQVAALRASGEVAVARGSGVDLEALSRLGLSGMRLLGRSGNLRTYYLAHTQGQLFLFPFGLDTLVVVGTPELNLGAAFTALGALKEEL